MADTHLTRAAVRAGIIAFVSSAVLLCTGATVAAEPQGHAARKSLHVDDHANLHKTRKNGNVIYEKGTATGTLPGTVTARFVTGVTKVTGTVTFHSRHGSITMNAVGYPQSAGTVARFTGSIAVRSGTRRYRNALGSGRFSGTVNRKTWAVSVDADAHITY